MAKILVVEDSNTQLYAYTAMLQRNQHTVVSAKNGEEGIALAIQSQPDLILMDIVMPQMDGFSATRKLRQTVQTAKIPIVVLTNKNQETDKVWALRQGATEFLAKPVDEKQLIDTINRVLGMK